MKLLKRIFAGLLLLLIVGISLFHFHLKHLLNSPIPVAVHSSNADLYYFAYGTNMSTRYLYNVRGVLPADSQAGMIEDYQVYFMKPGINALEPTFAYLLKSKGKNAYGVLHLVSKQDLEKIEKSEGKLYQWRILPVKLSNGQIIEAQTLVRLSPGDMGSPSRRYLQILLEGAVEHGLPAAYISELRGVSSVYVPVISELMSDILQAFAMQRSGKCASVLRC